MTINSDTTATGLDLEFFAPSVLATDNVNDLQDKSLMIARQALAILMMGWAQGDWGELNSQRVWTAVFIKRDSELLRNMRLAFQEGFHHIHAQLKDKNLTTAQHRQVEFFLSNCLSLLPFADITPHESIEIPQFINGNWVLVDYKVVPIELTSTSGFNKLFIQDTDRVFAYGLEPIFDHEAEPHLIFMGTTYPAGQGCNTQIHTDLEAFETAGKQLYRTGRQRIIDWLDKQGKKAHVCGMSLGGSLSLLLAIDQGDKLARVDALNPPGLYEPWRQSRYDRWNVFSAAEKPPVYIQKQGRDPVSCFGAWKPDWHVLHVQPPENKQGPIGLADHALNYAGFAQTRFVEIDTETDNRERKWRNTYIYTAARSLVYYFFELPVYYLIRPALKYALQHKIQTAFIVSAAILFPYLPATALCVLMAFSALLTAYCLFNIINNSMRIVLGQQEVRAPACHHLDLSKNSELNIYDNTTTATFSTKELGAYHYTKQCLIKDHVLKADEDAILKQSLNPQMADIRIPVTASKSKIYDIKQTITLINSRWGLHHTNTEVNAALIQQHQNNAYYI